MGIADDIKPSRRVHYEPAKDNKINNSSEEAAEKTEEVLIHQEEVTEEAPEPEEVPEKKDLKSFFFVPQKKTIPENNDEPPASVPADRRTNLLRNIFTTLTLIIFLAFMGIMVFQNKATIKQLFSNSEKTPAATNTDTNSTENSFNANEQITPTDYTNQNNGSSDTTQSSSETPTQNSTADSTTTPSTTTSDATASTETTLDKSAILLEVLNGNGVTGSADNAKAILTAAGFTVSKVANASKFTYEQTIIYYKSTKTAEAQAVKAALPTYSITLEQSDQIAKNYDVVVVIGKK